MNPGPAGAEPSSRLRRYRVVPSREAGGNLEFLPLDEAGTSAPEPGTTKLAGLPVPVHQRISGAAGTRLTPPGQAGLVDEVSVVVEDVSIRLSRELKTTLPHEVTVVIPRVDVTKRFQDGKLVEVNLAYAGITVTHSPRFPPKKG